MKQVFECGITGTSNDEVGDCFLARLADIPMPETHGRKLPDDFTIEVTDRDMMRGGVAHMETMRARYAALCEGMVERGYEVLRWRDFDKWCECIRFRRGT
jgi:hypothetical protein